MSKGVIITSEKERSFRNLFNVARNEERIRRGGLIFCQTCDGVVSLIMPYIEKIIKEDNGITDNLKKRDTYSIVDAYSQKSKASSIIDKILIENFKNYKRLSALQIDVLLETISDRIEGAYLGSCDMYWHGSPQKCCDCPLKDVCISQSRLILGETTQVIIG